MCCTTAIAQVTVKGTVVSDTDSEPLTGVAILEQGTSNGTITDIDGNFSLNLKSGKATLVVSYVGYTTQQISVNNRPQLNIRLIEDSKLLDDVVVVGYGVQRKSDLTGSVASVKADDLKGLATTDAAASLQGKASGVQILNASGAPGEGAQIRVRGYSSNSSNIGPLLIVDGLKVSNINYLDPSMIESMEVLKDAASAAIYGAQAGNGVILITTKSGKKGRVNVSYNGKFTLNQLGKQAEVFDGPGYLEYQKYTGSITDDVLQANGFNGKFYNWFDAVFEPTWSTQHSFTVQGGNDQGNYFANVNVVNNDGIIKGDKDVYKRFTAQINADYRFFKWLQVGSTTSFEKYERTSVSQSSYGSMLNAVMSLDPLTPAYYSRIEDCTPEMQTHYAAGDNILRDPKHNNDFYATSRYLEETTGNPLLQRDRQDSKSEGLNVRGSLFANFNLHKDLVFTSRFGYRITQGNSHSYSVPFWATSMAKGTDYNISANVNTGYYYQWENFANYNHTFAKKHSVSAMAGMSYTENHSDNASISSAGPDILRDYAPNFRYIDYLLPSATKTVGNAPNMSSQISYFGRLMYSYDNRYSIQANFRADAFDSSKLSKQQRWGYFPSFSAGWTLSNEKFIKDNISREVLSNLKLRASWGQNGNVAVLNNYPYVATISVNGQWYQYDPETGNQTYGSGPTDLANPNLKWETSEQIDLGLDARFLNDRLSLGIDWYKKQTKDLLVSFAPSPEIGVKSTMANAGNVENRGLEIELGWKDRIGEVTYGINANFSTLKNKVTALHKALNRIEASQGGVSGLNYQIRTAFEVGEPIWYFRGYKYAGANPEDGTPLYYDHDGQVVSDVTDNDLTKIGKAIPDATYGITITLGWKGFDFAAFGTGTIGNDIFSLLYSADRPRTNCLSYHYERSWKEGNTNAYYADSKKVLNNWKYWSSDVSIFNGSFFKIKQIELGYSLPKNLLKQAKIQNVRVSASLQDFFTFTKYPGCDPETATTGNHNGMGFDVGTYPTSKKVVFGVNVTF